MGPPSLQKLPLRLCLVWNNGRPLVSTRFRGYRGLRPGEQDAGSYHHEVFECVASLNHCGGQESQLDPGFQYHHPVASIFSLSFSGCLQLLTTGPRMRKEYSISNCITTIFHIPCAFLSFKRLAISLIVSTHVTLIIVATRGRF